MRTCLQVAFSSDYENTNCTDLHGFIALWLIFFIGLASIRQGVGKDLARCSQAQARCLGLPYACLRGYYTFLTALHREDGRGKMDEG